ncbi:Glycosyltransferase, GT2 family [Candidatus Kryptobacter tengchongensis]|uniref:Glycosyltransferase, GT2 family n=1 Tax=Kryptobacter tengchongensis TaxID=1643429 RepID=A0A656D453_KRYT1|nr:glycosyltransferase [Candidatus Kryptobacter tengchongensis]CUS98962.1 Glycosyltransferase, GT2 family [Candidatus Kryptobacter tengchongensis]CUT03652.1 Glycosyltransferase, GT2 family [Candidatus Kryptobacter tengchongensis]CUU09783.1 Glycosyltransferase, GT2 family [Candidatus Kryptobacter tengchongensis]
MKRFSLIIPTLNEEKTLRWAEKNFTGEIKQKYDIEIIISDGGSTDGTIEIARKFADKIILNEKKNKQTIAEGRNLGALNSNGEILIFLNADVRIDDIDIFFKLCDNLMKIPQVVALSFEVEVYPEEELLKDKIFHWFLNKFFAMLNVVGLGMGRGECHVIKRESFFEVNGYNDKLVAGEDFDLYMRLRRLGKIINVYGVKVYESPRRYRKYGYIRTLALWFFNSISIIFFKRSISKVWDMVR